MRLGACIAETLAKGDVVALYGDLGSGKTQLAKGICSYFDIPPTAVTSPTFTIVNEYTGGILAVYHIDAYRIRRLEELYELGFDSYLDGQAICIIEWPENIESALPSNTVRLVLSHVKDDVRRIEWQPVPPVVK
jgi:tRNA threonylcarbamoyladenosine biosynthesis protein TsaE